MPPTDTVWKLDPHTIGKHRVLRNYMEAWLPIMSKWNGRVVFIDAFAGPGEYEGGEPGSPIIALRALINHKLLPSSSCTFHYLFIEKDVRRSRHLDSLLNGMRSELPNVCKYQVVNGQFDETLNIALDKIEEQNTTLAPSLVMIDPFGVSDTPMQTISRILTNPKSEVYISFMYNFINRFKTTDGFQHNFDKLFGCRKWREGLDINDPECRRDFFLRLYGEQLRVAGAEYVLRFDIYEDARFVYAIFFGTHSLDGCDKMKQAIWKEAPLGNYRFRGDRMGQFTLGDDILDFISLRKVLISKFGTTDFVSIEIIDEFMKSDQTEFHSGHLRNKTLRPMEQEGATEVDSDSPRRQGNYPKGTRIRFKYVQGSTLEQGSNGTERSLSSQPPLFS